MAKSLRSKRARKFRAIKRAKNEVIETKRVLQIAAKLGTLPPGVPVPEDEPKRFSHKAPIVRARGRPPQVVVREVLTPRAAGFVRPLPDLRTR